MESGTSSRHCFFFVFVVGIRTNSGADERTDRNSRVDTVGEQREVRGTKSITTLPSTYAQRIRHDGRDSQSNNCNKSMLLSRPCANRAPLKQARAHHTL